jgi:DNA helicase-2/ATP-dependent DNA helicase PcrA
MDFDDQMVFALWILQKDDEITSALRARYRYICVDEAQDTSKIQHEIIKIIAQGNNLFMVGDEDQSIYGFRAAYPKALLNFRYDYLNPYILRMERNYRSTTQIVDKAQSFISQNKGRYEKNMTAERGDGEAVSLEQVESREMQYMRLLDIAKTADRETAFLYRDNESSVVLIDLFLRNGVPFRLRKPEMNFFGNRVVKDIVAYLSLALNENDTNSFSQICNKGIIYLKNQQKDYAIKNCKYKRISVYDAVEGQMQYLKENQRNRADDFRSVMTRVAKSKTLDAISDLMNSGYEDYLREKHLDRGKVEILKILAKQEPDIQKFLKRLKELEGLIQNDIYSKANNAVILSTIHSSKGLEYDCVYMVDVYDGRFPSSRPNIFSRSKDNADGEQEERRLFYVAITRAEQNCIITYAKSRFRNGNMSFTTPSRFLKDIDSSLLDLPQESFFQAPSINNEDLSFKISSSTSGNYASKWGNSKTTEYNNHNSSLSSPKRLIRVEKAIHSTSINNITEASNGDYIEGMVVIHDRFGQGVIKSIEGSGKNQKLTINFENSGEKKILSLYAKLTIK